MSISLLGLGTAVPEHTMSLAEATALAHAICNTADERQHRVLDVFYRKSGVHNRNTCLPHRIALTWLAEGNVEENLLSVATATTLGPTTQDRMQFYEEHAFPLARDATSLALAASQVHPEEITHLVTVSCTGFYSPGVDVQLMQHFGLRSTVERVHVGFMGCHGAINGLRVSNGLGALHANARI